jgi:hypothetical protein
MSLIHQKLYQSESLSVIDMPSYIFELTEYLKDSFEIRNSIRFILNIDSFTLPLSHSIPIGLIFNEAVTNAIKVLSNLFSIINSLVSAIVQKLMNIHPSVKYLTFLQVKAAHLEIS